MTTEELDETPAHASRRWSLWLATVLVVAAAGFAAWFGWSWWRAEDAAAEYAETREEVLRVGEQGIANLTTMDHRKFDEGMTRWLESSTGTLYDGLVQTRQESRQRIEAGRSATAGRVVDAAVTELDARAGSAKMLAVVEITVSPEGGQPAVRRDRFQAQLSRTETGWKLSSLGSVPVGGAT